MHALLQIGLSNALAASILALAAAGLGWLCRRPALTHGLWLLVLLKLITPPFVALPIARPSSWEPAQNAPSQPVSRPPESLVLAEEKLIALSSGARPTAATDENHLLSTPPSPAASAPDERAAKPDSGDLLEDSRDAASAGRPSPATAVAAWSWGAALSVLWLAGSALWFVWVSLAICRFRRLLRYAQPAPARLRRLAEELGHQLGLSRLPDMALVPGAISPMLWALGGRPYLLLPADLFERLAQQQQETLLVHELAHWKRRDHWVRGLELLVTGLFWWHPVVWWARREIREAEEQCCDAWVVWALPAAARIYATALLEAVDHLSRARLVLPPATSGIGNGHSLRRRLTMIMRGTTPRALSWIGFAGLLALSAAFLPMGPTWAQTQQTAPEDKPNPKEPAPQQAGDSQSEDIKTTQMDIKRLRANLQNQKAQLAVAEANFEEAKAAFKQAEAALNQAYLRWKRLKTYTEKSDLGYYPAAKTLVVKGTSRIHTKMGGVQVTEEESSADRLAELEKKIDALRQELEALRKQNLRSAAFQSLMERARAEDPVRSPTQPVYPPAGAMGEVRRFQGHGLGVSSVAFSPDGKVAVSGSYDTTVRLWDIATGKELRRLRGHDAAVSSVAVSPNGRRILSGAYDSTLILWDAGTGAEVRRLRVQTAEGPTPREHRQRIKSLAIAPDGHLAVSGGEDSTIRLWDLQTGEELRTYVVGSRSPVQTVAFSPDGKRIASGSFDGFVRIWDTATMKQTATFNMGEHTGWVLRVVFSPDGRRLLSSGADGAIRLWDLASGVQLRNFPAQEDKVECVAFSPDGRRVLSAGFDKTVVLWDAETGRQIAVLKGHTEPVLCVAFSPDGGSALSGSADETIRLWKLP